ncbi:M23/M56 family metallopeptidase [Duganella phyllosphaerae]|uniref:Regulatory protein BlaR1 n=1 Tax=Duganella phyllosphaerae TaxID=762836 RepID=A0A1E7W8X1_9BURK|nr:M23/M56 family metallopeptidase [Duganella phyllosphaerae]OEZ92686.1 regulatory protein BlaR1 [Duganella phyllosphaerae]
MTAATMAMPTLLLWQWLLACLGCVLAGLLVHGLLHLAARAWPALRGQRPVWLAAQAVVAGVALLPLLLPLLPALDRVTVAPTLTIAVPSPLPLALPSPSPSLSAAGRAEAMPAAPFATAGAAVVAGAEAGINVDRIPAIATTGAAGPAATATGGVDVTAPATTNVDTISASGTAASLLAWAPLLWAVIYLAGLAYAVLRLARAWLLWRGLLAGAQRLSRPALGAHGGFDAHQLYDIARHRVTVLETAAAVSPMLLGAWRPVLLLPRHLRDFPVPEQQLIIAHELQHRRARDPLWLGLSALVQTLLWFNPAPRWFGARLAWAVELACDRRVLAGRPAQQRKQYACALLAQWRVQLMAPPASALAFGAADAASAGERIEQLRQARPPALPVAGALTVATVLIGVLAASAVLQPALATATVPVAATAAPATPSPTSATPPTLSNTSNPSNPSNPASQRTEAPAIPIAWQYPLDKMRVSGFFGVMRKVSPRPSVGLDLPAPVGTPVRAAAAGIVLAAGKLDENNGRYGTTVVITSADSSSATGSTEALYAHLDTTAVQPGSHVVVGQVIGTVGLTGFTTGPHLHFQLRQNGVAIDPATMLTGLDRGLDRYATRHALSVRRQQLGY